MIFGYEFNSDAEMPEQMQLYFEQLDEEEGIPTETEVTYKYFKCKSCGVKLRVPKHKGKITITCPKCRTSFKGKS